MTSKKEKITVVVILLIALVLDLSYAYWQLHYKQEDKNLVNSSCFDISYLVQVHQVIPLL